MLKKNDNANASQGRRPLHVFSVDVEDYYHVEAFSRVVSREDWPGYQSRVEDNTRRVLDLLDRNNVRATFFILGWVAERHPGLVREIVKRGHEPACHSYWHRLIYKLNPEEFRKDTLLAKDVIEQAAGEAVKGYRAPSFSIVKRSFWALEILAEAGFTYDSSVFTIRHDNYGYPEAPRTPFRVQTGAGTIRELPMTTFRAANQNWPVAGGGYLRIFPFWYTSLGIQLAQNQDVPLISYIHPWEIDPAQPRLPGGTASRLRHYTNLKRMEGRLEKLFRLGQFVSFRESGLLEADGPCFSPEAGSAA